MLIWNRKKKSVKLIETGSAIISKHSVKIEHSSSILSFFNIKLTGIVIDCMMDDRRRKLMIFSIWGRVVYYVKNLYKVFFLEPGVEYGKMEYFIS